VADLVTDDELERLVQPDRPRGYLALLIGSIASGVACLAVCIVISQLLAPPDVSSSVQFSPLLMVMIALFAVLLGACIALGYTAARRKPPAD
jgi:hypothetical protein